MNLTINREAFAAALARQKPLYGGRSTLPILGSVLLRAEDGALHVTANNLDHALVLTVPAEVTKPGEIAVSGSRLTAAVARMTTDEVSVILDKKSVQIKCTGGDMKVTLHAFDASEFPAAASVTSGAESARITLPGAMLGRALVQTLPSAGEDETRYVLTGVCLCSQFGRLAAVATDGRRLAAVELDGIECSESIILPPTAARLLAELDVEGEVALTIGASHFAASGQRWSLVSKVIEGNFPNWQQVVPPPGKHEWTVGRAELLAAIPFVGVVLPEGKSVRLAVDGDSLTLSASGPTVGESSALLPADTKGGAITIGLNAGYLQDALKALDGEKVTFTIEDANAALRITEGSATIVLMPQRLG